MKIYKDYKNPRFTFEQANKLLNTKGITSTKVTTPGLDLLKNVMAIQMSEKMN